jgi:hypothetical protein
MLYTQTFTVRGAGQFPYDMLRYDQCFPADEGQSSLLSDNPLTSPDEFFRVPRTVKMKRIVDSSKRLPTVDRWKSFGWECEDVQTRKW